MGHPLGDLMVAQALPQSWPAPSPGLLSIKPGSCIRANAWGWSPWQLGLMWGRPICDTRV